MSTLLNGDKVMGTMVEAFVVQRYFSYAALLVGIPSGFRIGIMLVTVLGPNSGPELKIE